MPISAEDYVRLYYPDDDPEAPELVPDAIASLDDFDIIPRSVLAATWPNELSDEREEPTADAIPATNDSTTNSTPSLSLQALAGLTVIDQLISAGEEAQETWWRAVKTAKLPDDAKAAQRLQRILSVRFRKNPILDLSDRVLSSELINQAIALLDDAALKQVVYLDLSNTRAIEDTEGRIDAETLVMFIRRLPKIACINALSSMVVSIEFTAELYANHSLAVPVIQLSVPPANSYSFTDIFFKPFPAPPRLSITLSVDMDSYTLNFPFIHRSTLPNGLTSLIPYAILGKLMPLKGAGVVYPAMGSISMKPDSAADASHDDNFINIFHPVIERRPRNDHKTTSPTECTIFAALGRIHTQTMTDEWNAIKASGLEPNFPLDMRGKWSLGVLHW